ncbi:MAG: hypothetical protein ACJAXG_000052 [Celeribacter sp.]
MLTFSLNTFIKICLQDTGDKVNEIKRKLDGSGGYDFYKPFKRAARAEFMGMPNDEVEGILDAPSKDTERQYNRAIYNSVIEKYGNKATVTPIDQKNTLTFHAHGIEISLDPIFSFEQSGMTQAFSVWCPLKPKLSQKYGAVACYLMRQAYSSSPLGNAQFFFYDAVENKTFSEKQIRPNTKIIFDTDLNTISSLIKEL